MGPSQQKPLPEWIFSVYTKCCFNMRKMINANIFSPYKSNEVLPITSLPFSLIDYELLMGMYCPRGGMGNAWVISQLLDNFCTRYARNISMDYCKKDVTPVR